MKKIPSISPEKDASNSCSVAKDTIIFSQVGSFMDAWSYTKAQEKIKAHKDAKLNKINADLDVRLTQVEQRLAAALAKVDDQEDVQDQLVSSLITTSEKGEKRTKTIADALEYKNSCFEKSLRGEVLLVREQCKKENVEHRKRMFQGIDELCNRVEKVIEEVQRQEIIILD